MSWNLEGRRVTGKYLQQFEVSGVVTLSRVALGGAVKHTVELDQTIHIYGGERDSVILSSDDIHQVNNIETFEEINNQR